MSLPFYPENKLWESVLQQDTEVSFLFLGSLRGYLYARTKSSCLQAGAAPPPLQIFWALSRTFSNETSRVFKAAGLRGQPGPSTPRVGGAGKFTCSFHSLRLQLGGEEAQ